MRGTRQNARDRSDGWGRKRSRAAGRATIAALGIAVLGSPFSAAADLVDDFDDDLTNSELWSVIEEGTGVTVQETNQRLEVGIAASAAGPIFMGGYRSIGSFGGDVDVAVSYSLLEWPVKNGVRVGIALLSDGPPQTFWTMLRISGGGIEPFSDGYLTDYNTSLGTLVSTSDSSGALRIARSGNVVSAWYWSNGDWQLIRSEVVSSGAVQVEIAAWSHDAYFVDQPVRVAFDDLEAVPEPALGGLLGAGVVAIVAGPRRGRRA